MPTIEPFSVRERRNRLLATITLLALSCGTAFGNPVRDPLDQMSQGLWIAVAVVALGIEIAITAGLLIWIFGVERRLPVILGLVLLNAATFCVFVVWLQPSIQNTLVTESLIWLTESFAIVWIAGVLGSTVVALPRALGVAFVGNLISYLVGSSA
jgi:hypothetical protein